MTIIPKQTNILSELGGSTISEFYLVRLDPKHVTSFFYFQTRRLDG